MIKAILFDCFGVLVGKGFEYTYSLAGGDPIKDRDFINDMLGQANFGLISDDAFRAAMANHLGIAVDEWSNAVKRADLPDLELLTYIKQLRGKYKTAILSNANKGVLARKLGPEVLENYFDLIIVSADINMAKPDPRIYALAVERLGIQPEECVFIDDSESHLVPASQMGMHAIMFHNSEQTRRELDKILADPKS